MPENRPQIALAPWERHRAVDKSLANKRFLTFSLARVDPVVDQKVAHTFTKRGVFYFSRRVPKALQTRFARARVVTCLHTRSSTRARQLAAALSVQLEMAWAQMRLESVLKRGPTLLMTQSLTASAGPSVRLSEAADIYRRLRGGGKGKGFAVSGTTITANSYTALLERSPVGSAGLNNQGCSHADYSF